MVFFPPLSRQRLYTSPGDYFSLAGALFSGAYGRGQAADLLEQKMADLTGVAHAVSTGQARTGIYLVVRSIIEKTGKKAVILSPYTIHDVVNMVIAAGGRPVFADVQEGTCNIDPGAVATLLDDETALVLVTHLHGLACDVEEIAGLCRDRGAALVEDCAQAFGTIVAGKPVGTFGDAGIFSFGMMKNLQSFYGGMVITDDAALGDTVRGGQTAFAAPGAGKLAARALYGLALDFATWPPVFRVLTFWLFRYGYLHDVTALKNLSRSEINPVRRDAFPDGYRYGLSPAQAQIVLGNLDRVGEQAKLRIETARYYHDRLSDIPQITLPPLRSDGSHTYMAFPILIDDREGLLRHMMAMGRDCGAQHLRNCADLDCFAEFRRDCPVARKTAENTVLLPTYPRYGRREAEKTVEAVRAFYLS